MAIRLKLSDGSTVESDSVRELADFYKHIGRNGQRKVTEVAEVPVLNGTEPYQTAMEVLPPRAVDLLKILASSTEAIDTKDVTDTLGVEPRGIGGYLLALMNWGKRNGYERKQMVLKNRRKNGTKSVRTLMLTKNFRQLLREGRIPGMKLDT